MDANRVDWWMSAVGLSITAGASSTTVDWWDFGCRFIDNGRRLIDNKLMNLGSSFVSN